MARRCASMTSKIIRKFSLRKESLTEGSEKDPLMIVWTVHITKDGRQNEFFKRSYEIILSQYPDLRKIFLPVDSSCRKLETVLERLSRNLETFFKELMYDDTYQDEDEFAKYCTMSGMRHSSYSNEKFETYYWDVFVCSMIQVLEDQKVPQEQIDAWEHFAQKVIKHMKKGYEQGRMAQKKLSMAGF